MATRRSNELARAMVYTTMKPMKKASIRDTGYSSKSVRVLGSTELASVQGGLVSNFSVVTPASDYHPDIVEINIHLDVVMIEICGQAAKV